MRITHETPTEIVVKDSSLWMTYLFCGIAAVLVFAVKENSIGKFASAALFLLFGVITARATTFTFDAMQRMVRWRGFKPFKSEAATILFDEIDDITVEASSAGNNGATYRLALLTRQGTVPMAYAYTGSSDGYASLRRRLLAIIKPGLEPSAVQPHEVVDGIPAELASSLRSLLAQRRKIDAIALLRSHERIGLTEAKKRIDEMDAKMKASKQAAQP